MSCEFPSFSRDYLGFGLGLRSQHYPFILEHLPKVDWFEILTENYLVDGGQPLKIIDQIRENYPVVMHGVSMSLGSTDELNWDYLKKLKKLVHRIQPKWISDHLCWTGINNVNMHDLLPLPYTEEAITHVVQRIQQVQEFLGSQILIENVSSYITYETSNMTEWEFLAEIANRADCLILLDVNNIYVSAFNHNFNPLEYIHGIPINRVQQIHIAGHLNQGTHIIDTHDHPVIDSVWSLYESVLERFGKISTMIERDDNIPEFEELYNELKIAKSISHKVFEESMA